VGKIQVVVIEAVYIIITMVEINSEQALVINLLLISNPLTTWDRTVTLQNR
jgi:hypothetical protein